SLNRKDIKYVLGQPGISTNTTTYLLDTLYPTEFHISRLDMKDNVCAGTFAFRLINAIKKDTLDISGGRFDVTYQPD
ncbi:MAG: hypothetical protein Q7T20_07350, partial [Saprospiraceae bacterium]|nr:hypothetical protein [Saprospiraceae bacterium]